jgi:6-phosphogluconolactonase
MLNISGFDLASAMRILRLWTVLAGLASIGFAGPPSLNAQTPAKDYFVYFGTYTAKGAKGIYGYRFQPATGRLTPIGLVAEAPNPSFLAAHPNRRFLYAANEQEGTVSAFAIEPKTGALTFLNRVSSRGEWPCHVSVDRTGTTLLVANYGSGSVASLPIQADGRLGEATDVEQHAGKSVNPERQSSPHAHFISPSPDSRFALVADLGLDQVIAYRFDPAKGALVLNDPPFARLKPGSGPRHLAFHPNGKYVYVNGEMSSTVSAFSYDPAKGSLTEFQTASTLPAGFSASTSTAEIEVDRAGRFLYVSNRGHDSIAVFAIDGTSGRLTPVEQAPTGGRTPRHFALDPSGNYLLAGNQDSNTVVVYRVNAKTGRLTPAQTLTDVPTPVCIVFVEILH